MKYLFVIAEGLPDFPSRKFDDRTPLELATQEEATTFILYYGADNKLKAYDAIK